MKTTSKYKLFELALKSNKIEFDAEVMLKEFIEGYKFKHRSDYAIKSDGQIVLIVEIEGGVYTNGRHTRGNGYVNDILKYNAINMVLPLLRFTSTMVKNNPAFVVEFIKSFIQNQIDADKLNNFVKKYKK